MAAVGPLNAKRGTVCFPQGNDKSDFCFKRIIQVIMLKRGRVAGGEKQGDERVLQQCSERGSGSEQGVVA